MAITSWGYRGTIDEVQWAQMSPHISASIYGVVGTGDLAVSAVSGADRTVSVAPGRAWGNGVMDYVDSAVTLTHSIVGSGSRWDTVVVRRSWMSSPGVTTLAVVEGSSAKMIASGRNGTPGDVDDQPIALVRLTAGQTQPQEIIDLRCWAGNGGAQIIAEEAFSYLAHPGSTVWYNWRMYNYLRYENGTWAWHKLGDIGTRRTIPLSLATGWVAQGTVTAAQDVPHRINNMNVQVYRSGSSITVPADRWLPVGYLIPSNFFINREPLTGETVFVFPATVRTVGSATSMTSTYRNALIYLDVRDGTFRIRSAEGSSFSLPTWGRIYINMTWNAPFES